MILTKFFMNFYIDISELLIYNMCMKSKWSHLKDRVVELRKEGISMTKIEKDIGIPRSTLSYWFKNIKISEKKQKVLEKNKLRGLEKARVKAVIWHNKEKEKRCNIATKEAEEVLNKINTQESNILEIALSFLYLGEGAKSNTFSIANSNSNVLNFFLDSIKKLYKIDKKTLRYELHLRADQNEILMKKYWSQKLNIPVSNIKYCAFDPRTEGRKTRNDYKGVCVVYAGGIAYTRRLLEIARLYSNIISKQHS